MPRFVSSIPKRPYLWVEFGQDKLYMYEMPLEFVVTEYRKVVTMDTTPLGMGIEEHICRILR